MLKFDTCLNLFAIFNLLIAFQAIFLNQVKFELQVIQILEENEWEIDIHVI
jgi:hypothetical protein